MRPAFAMCWGGLNGGCAKSSQVGCSLRGASAGGGDGTGGVRHRGLREIWRNRWAERLAVGWHPNPSRFIFFRGIVAHAAGADVVLRVSSIDFRNHVGLDSISATASFLALPGSTKREGLGVCSWRNASQRRFRAARNENVPGLARASIWDCIGASVSIIAEFAVFVEHFPMEAADFPCLRSICPFYPCCSGALGRCRLWSRSGIGLFVFNVSGSFEGETVFDALDTGLCD